MFLEHPIAGISLCKVKYPRWSALLTIVLSIHHLGPVIDNNESFEFYSYKDFPSLSYFYSLLRMWQSKLSKLPMAWHHSQLKQEILKRLHDSTHNSHVSGRLRCFNDYLLWKLAVFVDLWFEEKWHQCNGASKKNQNSKGSNKVDSHTLKKCELSQLSSFLKPLRNLGNILILEYGCLSVRPCHEKTPTANTLSNG